MIEYTLWVEWHTDNGDPAGIAYAQLLGAAVPRVGERIASLPWPSFPWDGEGEDPTPGIGRGYVVTEVEHVPAIRGYRLDAAYPGEVFVHVRMPAPDVRYRRWLRDNPQDGWKVIKRGKDQM